MAFEKYRARMERRGANLGEVLRNQSDAVVNATFQQSTAYRPVMVKHIDSGLPVFDEDEDEILDSQFSQKSKYNITGDEVAYWLRFRPHALVEHPEIVIGSYVSIPDGDGNRSVWLIVHCEDDGEQKWLQVLECNWTFKYIINGKIYQTLGCQRYASSYNSGLFDMDRTTIVENVKNAFLPTNSDTNLIGYDLRMLISDSSRVIPLAWSVSKLITTIPLGLTKLTFAQSTFDPEHDNAELGLANYFGSAVTPVSAYAAPDPVTFAITYSGTKPTIKVGGSVKTFTAQLAEDFHFDILWSISDGTTTHTSNSYDNTTVTYGDYTVTTTDRTLQLKVARNYSLVGTVLTITAHCANGDEDTVEVEVVS